MNTRIVLLLIWILFAGGDALGQLDTTNILDKFDWDGEEGRQLHDKNPTTDFLTGSFLNQSEWVSFLKVQHHESSPAQITLRTLGPAIVSRITSTHYAIVGTVKYEGVAPNSYLEMWSYFAPAEPGGAEAGFFSRTLADSGPMAKMEGTDDGHEFVLPFDATGASGKLTRLEFNIHLAGSGSVEFNNVRLVQNSDGTQVRSQPPVTTGTLINVPAPAPPAKIDQLVINVSVDTNRNAKYSVAGVNYRPSLHFRNSSRTSTRPIPS
jgi:hypothetical protein